MARWADTGEPIGEPPERPAPPSLPKRIGAVGKKAIIGGLEQLERFAPFTTTVANVERAALQRLPGRTPDAPKPVGLGEIAATPGRVAFHKERAAYYGDPLAEALEERGLGDTTAMIPSPIGGKPLPVKATTAARALNFLPSVESAFKVAAMTGKGLAKISGIGKELGQTEKVAQDARAATAVAMQEALARPKLLARVRGAAMKETKQVRQNIEAQRKIAQEVGEVGPTDVEAATLIKEAQKRGRENVATLRKTLAAQGAPTPDKPGVSLKMLSALDRSTAKRVAVKAAESGLEAHRASMAKLFPQIGLGVNMGERARRGEQTLLRIGSAEKPLFQASPELSQKVLGPISGAKRAVTQVIGQATRFHATEGIGSQIATPRQVYRSAVQGTRLPGEIGLGARAIERGLMRAQKGQQSHVERAVYDRLHRAFLANGGTTDEALDAIKVASEIPHVDRVRFAEEVENLAKDANPLGRLLRKEAVRQGEQEVLASQIAALPTPELQRKAQVVRSVMDDMQKAERFEGTPVGYLAGYLPHYRTKAAVRWREASDPNGLLRISSVPGTGMAKQRIVSANDAIGEFNAAVKAAHPEFTGDFFEPKLTAMMTGRARGHAIATTLPPAYEKALHYAGARPIRGINELRNGEVLMYPPLAMKHIAKASIGANREAAIAMMNSMASGQPMDYVGMLPQLNPASVKDVETLAQAGIKGYAVPADVAKDLGMFSKRLATSLEEVGPLYREGLGYWKRITLAPFLSWHQDNLLGNFSTMWMRGFNAQAMADNAPALRPLMAGAFNKGLDDVTAINGIKLTNREWLDRWDKAGATRGGYLGTSSRSLSPEMMGKPRITKGDIPSMIPPQFTGGIPIPTLRKGLSTGERFRQAGHLRIGQALASVIENWPRAMGYEWNVSKGMPDAAAMDWIANTLFNFDEVPKAVESARAGKIPFLAWIYKALPLLGREAMTNPGGPVSFPTKLKRTMEAGIGAPENQSVFAANVDPFPIYMDKDGSLYSIGAQFPQQTATRFFPEPSAKPGVSGGTKFVMGGARGALSALGPVEQTGMRIMGINPQTGEAITDSDVKLVKRGPFYIPKWADQFARVWRPYSAFWDSIQPNYPTPPWMRAAKAAGVRIYKTDPKVDESMNVSLAKRTRNDAIKAVQFADTNAERLAAIRTLDRIEKDIKKRY